MNVSDNSPERAQHRLFGRESAAAAAATAAEGVWGHRRSFVHGHWPAYYLHLRHAGIRVTVARRTHRNAKAFCSSLSNGDLHCTLLHCAQSLPFCSARSGGSIFSHNTRRVCVVLIVVVVLLLHTHRNCLHSIRRRRLRALCTQVSRAVCIEIRSAYPVCQCRGRPRLRHFHFDLCTIVSVASLWVFLYVA